MPLLRLNVTGSTALPREAGDPLDARLAAALAALPPGAPVVVLAHGYKFSHTAEATDPHGHIFSMTPPRDCWKAVSWPRLLGFGRGSAHEALCLPLGWHATGSIHSAYARAERAGAALARLVDTIAELDPTRPVHVLGHSLGARVALCALPRLNIGRIDRMILIAPAEFAARARKALSSRAGKRTEVIHVTGRENRLYDRMFELALSGGWASALGRACHATPDNWLDLRLDLPSVLSELEAIGHRIGPARARVCHWSGYLRPGVFPLYAALVRERAALPLETLKAALTPAPPPRRARRFVHLRTVRALAPSGH